MGQIIAGEKKHASNFPIPGMKFGYDFDGIGNRNFATVNDRTGTYTANVANQYDERQVPGALDIRGKASTAARVTVNTESTKRLDEYFYKALAVDNSSAPQYPGVSVLAVRNNAGPGGEDIQSETSGKLFLAKNPEVFTHDAEGNLLSDGRWNNTWDGENRLIRKETIPTVPAAAKRKLEFAYDAEGRRIRKQVFTWNGSTWVLQKDIRFLYDGWNLIAELDAANTMLRNFVWGLDLSRSPQGAGGVGGLLAIHEGTESHLPAYDGNGNVMALVKASDQSISARYEYGPFGETLVVEENGVSNPFRFSTKYLDSETGLYYYGYRYYDPSTGRWLNKDPIEERGGVNLYGFVGNDGVNRLDYLGLENWITYTSDYGDTESGQPKTTSEIWGIVNRNGVLRHSAEERAEPVNGRDLRIFGEVVQRGEVAKQADENPNDQGKCCIQLDVIHIVDSLTIYNGSLAQVPGDNYLGVAAHEANHIQAGFKRIFKIVDDYNKQEKPCFPTAARAATAAIEKRDKIKKEITAAMNSEGAHDTDGGFGTPATGTPGTWTGPPAW